MSKISRITAENPAVKRKRGRPAGQPPGHRILQAQAEMQKRTKEAVDLVMKAARKAAEKGQSGPAEFVLTHAAGMHEGKEIRPIAASIDKQQIDQRGSGVQILIGSAWGSPQPAIAVREVPQLPEAIDAESEN